MKIYKIREVARICRVAPRTVQKWFDSGRLKGYTVTGLGPCIPHEYLVRFMQEHGMPTASLEPQGETPETSPP
jgi:two-component system response regulator RpaA